VDDLDKLPSFGAGETPRCSTSSLDRRFMVIPTSVSRLIELRLAEFLSGPSDVRQDIARRYGALPVYSDMGGNIFLTPSGDVVFLGDEGVVTALPGAPPDWALVARIAAAEKYPELAGLVPTRPDSAPNCPACGGAGRQLELRFRCGSCLGLGWVRAV
jgi:hypothetical protein